MRVKLTNENYDQQMGVAPIVAAGISLVPSLIKGVSSIFKKPPPPPPPPPKPAIDPKIVYMGGAAMLALMTALIMRRR